MVKTKFSKKQLFEAGIICVILLLLIDSYFNINFRLGIFILMLFIDLIFPVFYYPFAFVWYNLSEFLGKVVSKVILGIIFFIIVVPVGIFRKLMGKDTLMLNKFNKDNQSVLKIRNYTYQPEDFYKPY